MLAQDNEDFSIDAQLFQVMAWICFASLALNGVKGMSEMLGPLDVQSVSYVDLFNEFWKALLTNLPTFLLAWAVFDLAGFFGRCGEGNIFTPRNVRTLKIASECLAWAAIVDVIIAPTVISWIERDARGIIWNSNDLAYGVFAIGLALYGFAFVLSQAVKIKEENDEMV